MLHPLSVPMRWQNSQNLWQADCAETDNDSKVVCITFCKLYPSFREPTECLLVWSFLYMRFVIR
jgi:hypothetical protein